MNELDLSPFKVEFDRDITFEDIKNGDFFYCVSAFEPSILKPQLCMATIDVVLGKAHPVGIVLEKGLVGIFFCAIDESINGMIKAIYRINKFKY